MKLHALDEMSSVRHAMRVPSWVHAVARRSPAKLLRPRAGGTARQKEQTAAPRAGGANEPIRR